jgi:DNA-directed RNA polymerase subunit omega
MDFLPLDKLLDKVENRYQLVLIAAKRARELASGAPTLLKREEKSKPTTIALQELANNCLEHKIEKE